MYMYLIVYINVMYAFMYVCMVCMMYVRMYVSIYLYLYLYIYIYQCNLLYYIYILSVGKIWNLPNQVSQSVSQKILITYQV